MSKQRTKDNRKHPWPATEIVRHKVDDLIPYARNSRTHSAEQVAQIAAAIQEWGWTSPILVDEQLGVIAGHGRLLAARKLGIDEVPCVVARDWTEAQKRAFVIADNKLAENAGWDESLLRVELRDLQTLGFELGTIGYEPKKLEALLEDEHAKTEKQKELEQADTFDGVKEVAVSKRGDRWLLGPHRVLCGDSTDEIDVLNLLRDDIVDVVHADPPYGMGEEADGVLNDNLRNDSLDLFQIEWLKHALRHAKANCGVYVWGNAPDLWRLWYRGGLRELDQLLVRNELVWSKGSAFGMNSDDAHSYPPETERCLFLMRGQQFLGNQNKADYWEGYEPLRSWLSEQRDAAGWTNRDVNRITGSHMSGHWFTKSQFYPINRENYELLQREAKGAAFVESYDDVMRKFAGARDGGNAHRRDLSAQMRERRSYFDNTHDLMTDVWKFGRVVGEERFGHATPKPVAMVARALKSSCPPDGSVFEPFLGTGSTLIAADVLGVRCFGMELEPLYVDVVVRRWQDKTKQQAVLDGPGGETFDKMVMRRQREARRKEAK